MRQKARELKSEKLVKTRMRNVYDSYLGGLGSGNTTEKLEID